MPGGRPGAWSQPVSVVFGYFRVCMIYTCPNQKEERKTAVGSGTQNLKLRRPLGTDPSSWQAGVVYWVTTNCSQRPLPPPSPQHPQPTCSPACWGQSQVWGRTNTICTVRWDVKFVMETPNLNKYPRHVPLAAWGGTVPLPPKAFIEVRRFILKCAASTTHAGHCLAQREKWKERSQVFHYPVGTLQHLETFLL